MTNVLRAALGGPQAVVTHVVGWIIGSFWIGSMVVVAWCAGLLARARSMKAQRAFRYPARSLTAGGGRAHPQSHQR